MTSFYAVLGILLQALLLTVSVASNSEAQPAKSVKEVLVEVEFENAELENVFESLENQTTFRFVYDINDRFLKKRFSYSAGYVSVENLLLQLSGQLGLAFKQVNNNITVKKKKKASLNVIIDVITVKGQVTSSEDNQGIPGVSIIIKGTNLGTVTDANGNYSIDVPDENVTLVFSSVGFVQEEVVVGNQININISLVPDITALEELVIVGYGSQRKQEVTGAVAKADLETFKEVPVNNVLETVKGTLPGLNVGGINSAGEVASFTIRGANTIAGQSNPLVVVDGVIFPGSLGDIRSADIASFTVLKDASAASIYGARSANGVILIETHKGKANNGKPSFNLRLNAGVSNDLEPLDIYSGDAYIQNILDIRAANDLEADPNKITQYLEPIEAENYNATPDHRPTLSDPFEVGAQDAYLRSADFSVQNSTDKNNYYIGLGITDQQGVVLNDNFKHFSARINYTSQLTDWLNLGVTSFYSFRDFTGSEPGLQRLGQLSPYASIYDEFGNIIRFPQTTTSLANPLINIATDHSDLKNNLNGAITANIDIPWVEGLRFKSILSKNMIWNEQNEFFGKFTIGEDTRGMGSRSYSKRNYVLFDNIITYDKLIADKHKIGLTLLYSQENTNWEDMRASGQGFANEALGHYKLEDAEIQNAETGGGESAAFGKMARLNYTYSNKYSLTATFRRDGYSAFSENKKWANFASAGISWNIGEEAFMSKMGAFSHLNVSVSYGSAGNRSIQPYQTLASLATGKIIYAENPGAFIVTQAINKFATPNLGWETTTGFNGGIGFGLFEERISGRVDWYSNITTDLLFDVPLAGISGGPETVTDNLGELTNKGIEISIQSVNVKTGDFKWTSMFNFSLNRNKVKTIFGKDEDGDGVEDDLVQAGFFIGRPLNTIYDFKVLGLWQQADVDNGTIQTGMRPGDYKTEDVPDESGVADGVITSDKDRQILGTEQPNFRWSLTNVFEYKKFKVMAYLYSIWGGNDYYLSGNNTPYFDFGANVTFINHPIYDYWTPTNTGAQFPRPDYRARAAFRQSREYIDRSFVKLQKVAISYDFTDLVKKYGIHGLNVTLSADNLFTYAPHWIGLDPETDQGLVDRSRPSIRTYLLSASFNF